MCSADYRFPGRFVSLVFASPIDSCADPIAASCRKSGSWSGGHGPVAHRTGVHQRRF
jgi:hypothetical protein